MLSDTCTISIHLAYMMLAYVIASIIYLLLTKKIGTPFRDAYKKYDDELDYEIDGLGEWSGDIDFIDKGLREYQQEAVIAYQKYRIGIVQLPTRTGKTRSGRRFRGVVRNVNKSMKRVMKSLTPKKDSKKLRKQRSNKGVKRGARTGKTRSGRRFRPRA